MLQAQQNHHDYDDFARAIQDKPPIHDAVSSRDFEDFLSSKYFSSLSTTVTLKVGVAEIIASPSPASA